MAADLKVVSEQRVKTWCCVDQGTSTIEVTFDRNTFTPHETASAHVAVYQERCNANMSGIRLCVQQEIDIEAKGHRFRDVITLVEKHVDGVHARTADVQ